MKRMYIALGLVIICIIVGIVEFTAVNYSSDKCISYLENIDRKVEKDNIKEAEKICKKAIEEYEYFTENIMYCFYQHSSLEEISQNLEVMAETLKIQDINRYKTLSVKTKEQLQAIKDEELFSVQNLL